MPIAEEGTFTPRFEKGNANEKENLDKHLDTMQQNMLQRILKPSTPDHPNPIHTIATYTAVVIVLATISIILITILRRRRSRATKKLT